MNQELFGQTLSNRLHDQHSNLGSHENGSQYGPSVPGSRLNADHPENGVLIPCRNTLWFLGYPDQALRTMDEALSLAQEADHPFSVAFALDHQPGFCNIVGK
jgi:hypothetical protein